MGRTRGRKKVRFAIFFFFLWEVLGLLVFKDVTFILRLILRTRVFYGGQKASDDPIRMFTPQQSGRCFDSRNHEWWWREIRVMANQLRLDIVGRWWFARISLHHRRLNTWNFLKIQIRSHFSFQMGYCTSVISQTTPIVPDTIRKPSKDVDDVDRVTGHRITAPVAYCESLLVLAFHLIVAQSPELLGMNPGFLTFFFFR